MNATLRIALPACAGLLAWALPLPAAAAPVPAPPPPEGPHGGAQGAEELEEVSRRISKALRENEEALARLARGEKAKPGKVDIEIPPSGSSSAPPPPAGASGGGGGGSAGAGAGGGSVETLRGSSSQGRAIVQGIDEFLRIASQMSSSSSSSSSGGEGHEKGGGEEGKDRNAKKDRDPSGDPLKDNQEGKGAPKDGDPSRAKPDPKSDVPPPSSEKGNPTPRDLKGVFFAKLPDTVREAVLNGDFDQVPEKYREMVREWTRALAEKEAERERR